MIRLSSIEQLNQREKIVTKLLLEKIWNDEEEVNAERGSYLTKDELIELLKDGPVQFVEANVGDRLKWIDPIRCFDYWKSEVQPHFADAAEKIYLDQFPDEYAYLASGWQSDFENPLVLLEKFH